MDNETEKIFAEQLDKLPSEVVDFVSSSSWDTDADEIASLYNLSEENLSVFKREVSLVLAGLLHPDDFMYALERAGLQGSVLEALVLNVEKKIFVPIRPALIAFFEKEAVKTETLPETHGTTEEKILPLEVVEPVKERTFNSPFSAIIQPTPVKTWEKAPEVVPENLPTEETTESFLPNLTPKTITPESTLTTPVAATEPEEHPFEEKMKKVFTAGQQSMGELVIEPPTQRTEEQKTPQVYHTDPYREPIE